MAENIGINIDLIRNNLFDIQLSSKIIKQPLKLNSLTEENTLVVDDKGSDGEDNVDGRDGDEEEEGNHDERTGRQGKVDDNDEHEYDIEEKDELEANDEGDDIEELNNNITTILYRRMIQN